MRALIGRLAECRGIAIFKEVGGHGLGRLAKYLMHEELAASSVAFGVASLRGRDYSTARANTGTPLSWCRLETINIRDRMNGHRWTGWSACSPQSRLRLLRLFEVD